MVNSKPELTDAEQSAKHYASGASGRVGYDRDDLIEDLVEHGFDRDNAIAGVDALLEDWSDE